MKSKRRRLRLFLGWLSGIFLSLSILFSVIIAPLQAHWGEEEYKGEFDSRNQGAVVMSLDEWSNHFAGAFGLSALNRLSQDQSLMPSGRRIALEIRDHIISGRHQLHLQELLRRGWWFWPLSCAVAYIYVIDGFYTGHWISAASGPEYPY